MFSFQLIITEHTKKKKEIMTHSKKWSKWIKTVLKEKQIFYLLDKDIKTIILKMVKYLKKNKDERLKEIRKVMNKNYKDVKRRWKLWKETKRKF